MTIGSQGPGNAGWYPDPLGGQGARYWDGTQWDGALQSPTPQEEEFPEASAEKSRRVWPIWAGLALTVAIVAGAAAFVLTRPAENAPTAAPSTLAAIPATPTVSPAELAAANVKISMHRKLDSDPDLKRLKLTVVDVMLVNKSGNEFKGLATVKTPDGTEHDVPVDVTSDNDNVLWETPPGAFIFERDEPSPPPSRSVAPPPSPPVADVENFTVCPSGLTGVASAETSCAFADNVRSSWYSSMGNSFIAYSPVTDLEYRMSCAPASTNMWPEAKRCVGSNAFGATLVVYID